nr:dienelactone hydrolase family [uncultured bacterium]
MQRAGADVEVFRYPGVGHLFTDPDLPDHDAQAAEEAWRVALAFIESL